MLKGGKQFLLDFLNTMHEKLKFTIEEISEAGLPFLDMALKRKGDIVTSRWFRKSTDTGIITLRLLYRGYTYLVSYQALFTEYSIHVPLGKISRNAGVKRRKFLTKINIQIILSPKYSTAHCPK